MRKIFLLVSILIFFAADAMAGGPPAVNRWKVINDTLLPIDPEWSIAFGTPDPEAEPVAGIGGDGTVYGVAGEFGSVAIGTTRLREKPLNPGVFQISDDGVTWTDWEAGVNGRTVLNGSGVPDAGLGSDGDFYYDPAASTMYGPKAAGAWPAGVSLAGAPGANGADGADGVSAYLYVRYASDDSGTGFSATPTSSLSYRCEIVSATEITPDASDCTGSWVNWQGGTFADVATPAEDSVVTLSSAGVFGTTPTSSFGGSGTGGYVTAPTYSDDTCTGPGVWSIHGSLGMIYCTAADTWDYQVVSGSDIVWANWSNPKPTPPTFVSATIGTGGATTDVTFSEECAFASYAQDMTMTCTTANSGTAFYLLSPTPDVGTPEQVNFAHFDDAIGSNPITIYGDDTCTISFGGAANSIEDLDGDDLAAFGPSAVTNGSTQNSYSLSPLIIRPGSDLTTEWTPSTGTDHYAVVDESSPNGTDFLSCSGTNDIVTTFGLSSSPNLPPTATNISVTVHNVLRFFDGTSIGYRERLVVGGTTYIVGQATQYVSSGIFSEYSHAYTNNPATASAWTASEINTDLGGFGVGSYFMAGAEGLDLDQSYITITWD